jgi:hypothetical protein
MFAVVYWWMGYVALRQCYSRLKESGESALYRCSGDVANGLFFVTRCRVLFLFLQRSFTQLRALFCLV